AFWLSHGLSIERKYRGVTAWRAGYFSGYNIRRQHTEGDAVAAVAHGKVYVFPLRCKANARQGVGGFRKGSGPGESDVERHAGQKFLEVLLQSGGFAMQQSVSRRGAFERQVSAADNQARVRR